MKISRSHQFNNESRTVRNATEGLLRSDEHELRIVGCHNPDHVVGWTNLAGFAPIIVLTIIIFAITPFDDTGHLEDTPLFWLFIPAFAWFLMIIPYLHHFWRRENDRQQLADCAREIPESFRRLLFPMPAAMLVTQQRILMVQRMSPRRGMYLGAIELDDEDVRVVPTRARSKKQVQIEIRGIDWSRKLWIYKDRKRGRNLPDFLIAH